MQSIINNNSCRCSLTEVVGSTNSNGNSKQQRNSKQQTATEGDDLDYSNRRRCTAWKYKLS